MRRLLALIAVLVAPTLVGCSHALVTATPVAAAAKARLSVEGAWVRTTTGAKDTSATAVYLTIVNPGDEDVKMTSADCADAGVVQMHEMVPLDGKMIMQETKEGIPVPAGSDAHLIPGGFHIMLMMLNRTVAVGNRVSLTLHFSDGGSLEVTAPVKEFIDEANHYPSPTPVATASS